MPPTISPPQLTSSQATKSNYIKGTANPSNIAVSNISANPNNNSSTKFLVIKGIAKHISTLQVKGYIINKAQEIGCNINLLGDPLYINHKDSKSNTAVVEVAPDDFAVMLNPNFWDSNLKVKEFVGFRFWQQKRRHTQEKQNFQFALSRVAQSWLT